ncbi:MAG: hypothetical protein M3Q22_12200 [Actinomycetota bacterium]|nr:hypothetical protein [Actinomycetota bacterium]
MSHEQFSKYVPSNRQVIAVSLSSTAKGLCLDLFSRYRKDEPVLSVVAISRTEQTAFRHHRPVVEGVSISCAPERPGGICPGSTAAGRPRTGRHQKWSHDGTWDDVLAALHADADADAEGELDWRASVDSTLARVHQHAATTTRSVSKPSSYTRGSRLAPGRTGLGASTISHRHGGS